jgi:hypothetical protein
MVSAIVGWAVIGRVTGRVVELTTDEDIADEMREHYEVVPLFIEFPDQKAI